MNAMFTKTFLAAAVLASAVAMAPAAPSTDVEQDEGIPALVRQIDIMRLVLSNSINRDVGKLISKRVAEDDEGRDDGEGQRVAPAQQGFLQTAPDRGRADVSWLQQANALGVGWSRSSFTSHTRGFYAEGLGAIFSTEVALPIVGREVEDEPDDEVERRDVDDEWDQAARRLDGTAARDEFMRSITTRSAVVLKPRKVWTIDETFIDATVDSVLRMLIRHGLRLEDLPADDDIVVALRLEPGHSLVAQKQEGDVAAATLWYNVAAGGVGGGGGASPVHVVIRVNQRDIEKLDGDVRDAGLKALRRASTITRY